MKQKVRVWYEISQEDFEVAELTFKSSRYLHTAFMCQQAIEKAVKAVYSGKFDKVPPKKHDLLALCRDTGIYEQLKDDWKDVLARLSSLYILSRYPEDELRKPRVNKELAERLLNKTREVLKWLKTEM